MRTLSLHIAILTVTSIGCIQAGQSSSNGFWFSGWSPFSSATSVITEHPTYQRLSQDRIFQASLGAAALLYLFGPSDSMLTQGAIMGTLLLAYDRYKSIDHLKRDLADIKQSVASLDANTESIQNKLTQANTQLTQLQQDTKLSSNQVAEKFQETNNLIEKSKTNMLELLAEQKQNLKEAMSQNNLDLAQALQADLDTMHTAIQQTDKTVQDLHQEQKKFEKQIEKQIIEQHQQVMEGQEKSTNIILTAMRKPQSPPWQTPTKTPPLNPAPVAASTTLLTPRYAKLTGLDSYIKNIRKNVSAANPINTTTSGGEQEVD